MLNKCLDSVDYNKTSVKWNFVYEFYLKKYVVGFMYWVLCSYGTYLAERILIVTRHPLSGLLQLSCSYPLISTEKILYGFGSGFGLGFFCVWVWRLVLGFKEETLLYLFLTCLLRQRRLGHSVCPCSN